jgi:hypothetical protein
VNLATAVKFQSEIARLQAEIDRLRVQPCPHVTGTVTRYCTLTPLTLTDAERDAIDTAAMEAEAHQHAQRAATLRGLLERTHEATI